MDAVCKGQGLSQTPLPNVHLLSRKAMHSCNFELGLLSPPGSVASESVSAYQLSGMNYGSVMATLAKAIAICQAEKNAAEENYAKYSEVTSKYQ